MEAQITNEKAIVLYEQLNALMNEKVTIGFKNRIVKTLRKLKPIVELVNEMNLTLIKQFGATEKTPGTWIIEGTPPQEYLDSLKELFDVVNTITIDRLDFKRIEELESDKPYDFTDFTDFFENL